MPLGYLVKQLHQALRVAAEESLRDYRISLPQLAVLIALEQSPGRSNAELARESFMTPPSMVELLSRLEDAGLISRWPRPGGGRILQARLTPAGLAVVRDAQARLQDVEERLLAGLTADERDRLRELLGRCIASLSLATPSPARAPAVAPGGGG